MSPVSICTRSARPQVSTFPRAAAAANSWSSTPTAVSQHLSKLRLAGLVTSRREGTYIHYSATNAHVHRLLAEALSHAEHTSGLVPDTAEHRYRTPAGLPRHDG